MGRESLRSDPSGFVSAIALQDNVPPASPRDLVVEVDVHRNDRLLLSWNAPVGDEDGDLLTGLEGYLILRSEVGTTGFAAVDTVGVAEKAYEDDNDLKPLTLYAYAIVAFDAAGNRSIQSVSAQARTGGVAVPGGLLGRGEIGRIVLTWLDSAAEGLLGYNVYRSTRSDSVYEHLANAAGFDFTTGQTSYVDTVLASGEEYFYKISAVTSDGESERSGFVGAEVLPDDKGPGMPQGVLAVLDASLSDQVIVSWIAPTTDVDGGRLTGLAGYVVLRSEGGNTSFVEVARVGADALIYEDSGLEPLTLYVYAVVALDEAGNESALAVDPEARTGGVAVPSSLLARGEISRIVLMWFDSVEESLLGYNVHRSTVSDGDYERLGLAGSSFTTGRTSYVDEDVVGGTDYYYKVSAVVLGGGESSRSVFVGATALLDDVAPGVPQDLTAQVSQDSIGQVVLRWTAPLQDADGGELTGLDRYVVLRREEDFGALVSVATLGADSLDAAGGIPGAGVVEYVDRDLDSLTVYEYSVIAIDAAGNESSRLPRCRYRAQV